MVNTMCMLGQSTNQKSSHLAGTAEENSHYIKVYESHRNLRKENGFKLPIFFEQMTILSPKGRLENSRGVSQNYRRQV